jgi:hypothetical protein
MNLPTSTTLTLFFLFCLAVILIERGCSCEGCTHNFELCGMACQNTGSHMAWYRDGSCVCESALDAGDRPR